MKKYNQIKLTLQNYIKISFLLILIQSCGNDENLITNPETSISFNVKKTSPSYENSTPDHFETKVKTIKAKDETWRANKYADQYSLHRSKAYELELANGRIIQFEIDLHIHEEDTSLLVINEDNSWHYVSKEIERNQLLLATINLTFDQAYWYWFNCESDCRLAKITSIQEAEVNGTIQNYMTINFEGDIGNGYDHEGYYMGYYTIENGQFADVLLN